MRALSVRSASDVTPEPSSSRGQGRQTIRQKHTHSPTSRVNTLCLIDKPFDPRVIILHALLKAYTLSLRPDSSVYRSAVVNPYRAMQSQRILAARSRPAASAVAARRAAARRPARGSLQASPFGPAVGHPTVNAFTTACMQAANLHLQGEGKLVTPALVLSSSWWRIPVENVPQQATCAFAVV